MKNRQRFVTFFALIFFATLVGHSARAQTSTFLAAFPENNSIYYCDSYYSGGYTSEGDVAQLSLYINGNFSGQVLNLLQPGGVGIDAVGQCSTISGGVINNGVSVALELKGQATGGVEVSSGIINATPINNPNAPMPLWAYGLLGTVLWGFIRRHLKDFNGDFKAA